MNNKKGILLLVIILALVLLIFIGLIFANLATVESKSVLNFINKKKSFFLSESGFYYSVVRLLVDMRNGNILNTDWQFMGEDINKNGILDDGEDKNRNGLLDTVNVPLTSENSSVSYQHKKLGSNEIANQYFSYLLTSGEEYGIFKLKIVDEASKININYGNLLNPDASSNQNLKRILNTLGTLLGVPLLGDKILQARGQKGFIQLEELINTALSYNEFQQVKDYITTSSYGTLLPKPVALTNRINNKLKEGAVIYSISEIYPQNIEKEVRYLVNINTAPYEVLVSLLVDLDGYYIDGNNLGSYSELALTVNKEGIKGDKYTSVPIGIIKKTKPIMLEQAKEIAKQIMQKRIKQPFTNYYGENGWGNFIEQLYINKIVDFYQKEVLQANFNPNVNSYLWNPDSPLRFLVDKFSLVTNSFEWTFLPTGFFTIESIGEIFNKDFMLSKTHTQKFIKLWETSFSSTQEDFAGTNFQHFDSIFNKVDKNYTTRLGYELDLYPYMYPLEKKASNFTGYIGLSTISLPTDMLTFQYTHKGKESILKPNNKITFNKGYIVDEPSDGKLAKSDEALPHIFTDGSFSDTERTIRLVGTSPPELDTTSYDPNKNSPTTQTESYPVRVAISYLKGDLTILSDKLLGFLEELNIDDSNIFTSFTRSTLAGVSIKDLKEKKLTLFLPHSCCFWDVYWEGGEIHFYIPEHADELIEKYFPDDVKSAIAELCADQENISSFLNILGIQGLQCSLGGRASRYSMGIYFWHKGNWFNKEAVYPLVSFGRLFPENIYGKNDTTLKAEGDAIDEKKLKKLIQLYNKKDRFHSSMIQDFYFAFSFIDKGKLFKKNKPILYLDFATPNKNIETDEKRPFYYNFNYISSYTSAEKQIQLTEGEWNLLGIFFEVKSSKESQDSELSSIEFQSAIFKNNEIIQSKPKFLVGDLQTLREQEKLPKVKYVLESIGKYINPGLRFGEYTKRGYAKTDKPVLDPYLFGFATSQSTYDEIYTYNFDEEAVKQSLYKKINETLFKSGRYYPFGGSFNIGQNFWKQLSFEQNFIASQVHFYISPQIERYCSVENTLSIKNKKFNLDKLYGNTFSIKENITVGNIDELKINLDCKVKTPLLESPFIDSLFIFTFSNIKEVVTSKEIRDVSY